MFLYLPSFPLNFNTSDLTNVHVFNMEVSFRSIFKRTYRLPNQGFSSQEDLLLGPSLLEKWIGGFIVEPCPFTPGIQCMFH